MPENKLSTRDRIDLTALHLFAEKGVDQTTTRDITEGAGIAEGTLYRHYQGKGDMVWRLFSANYAHLADELDRLQRGEAALEGKISAMIGAFCELYDSAPDIFRFLFLVQHGQLSRVPSDMKTPVQVVCDVVAAGIENGEIPAQDPALGAAMVFGLVTQPAVFKIYGRIDAPMGDMAAPLARAAMRVLHG